MVVAAKVKAVKKKAVKDKPVAKPVSAKPKVDVSKLPTLQAIHDEQARRNDLYFFKYYIKIVNKDGEQVPFVVNPIQQKIDDKINELEAKGIPARIIVLKARQEGVSTYTQGKFVCRTVKNSNRNALVVAHRDDSTSSIFGKAKYMTANLPPHIQPLQKASNARELIFDVPASYKGKQQGLNSMIKVQTAGSEGIGRSDTYHYVHLSEFAFYSGDPLRSLAGILQSVPNVAGTIVLIESTANGTNSFMDLWDMAVKGENDFVPMFFAWHDYPLYQMPVTDEQRKGIEKDIEVSRTHKKDCKCGFCYEKNITDLYSLTAEQISWYRWKLRNDCNNDTDLMKQENPSFAEESFLSTGRPVFANELIRIRINQLKKEYKEHPPKVGRFSFEWVDGETQDQIKNDSIHWIDDPSGTITIYEDVKEGYFYCAGGDTKGIGKDYYAASLINNITGFRSASLHMQSTNSKPYTYQMYCLGRHYNDALLGIEVNFNSSPIEELERLRYPKQYMRESYDKISREIQKRFGFKTDGNSRPIILDKEIFLIENHIELFTDITMLNECLTFVYDKDNRPDAQSGKHDDLLISDCIANEIRPQQRMFVGKEETHDYSKLPDDIIEDLENARSPEARAHILKSIGR